MVMVILMVIYLITIYPKNQLQQPVIRLFTTK
jgi:hypothetical protein